MTEDFLSNNLRPCIFLMIVRDGIRTVCAACDSHDGMWMTYGNGRIYFVAATQEPSK